jgi:cytochrome c-type protein NapC
MEQAEKPEQPERQPGQPESRKKPEQPKKPITLETPEKRPGVIKRAWRVLISPSKFSFLGIASTFFFAGILLWNGFWVGLDTTSTMEFCTSCHSMQVNLEEYKKTAHWQNRSGVRADCAACHVPHHNLGAKLIRKMWGITDVIGEMAGTIDTPDKYEARRMQMAQAEWDRYKANGSAQCRGCHDFDAMSLEKQGLTRFNKHQKAKADGQTCMDCHKGIAHKLPKSYHDPEEDEEDE